MDLHSAPRVQYAIERAVENEGVGAVVVDLGDVAFMDSTGLEVLLATRRRTELEGGSLTLVGPTPAVLRVLEVTGLDKLFTIAADDSGAPV